MLERRPYRVPGQRTRSEYVLTERGRDLLPALLALGEWSRKHSPEQGGPTPLHDGCGAEVTVVMQCDAGHRVVEDELVLTSLVLTSLVLTS